MAQEASGLRPNFVFILTDDQSYGYMGCTGNELVQTPHLDQLAADGTLFTNAHVSSAICTPSRISILLGQYERKHGVNFNSGTSIAPEAWAQSYPVVMRKAGYYAGYIGKNHAPIGKGGYESGLMEASFDYWYAGHGHLGFYPKKRHSIFNQAAADTQIEIMDEGVSDFLSSNEQRLEGAVRFLEQRPDNQPFVLSICFNLPHSASTKMMEQRPTDPEIYRSLYRDLEIPLPENYLAKADIVLPKLPPDIHRTQDRQTGYDYVNTPEELKERYIRQLQAMTGIDRLVGNLREKLDEMDLADNTVLIFTSDHGLFMGQQGLGGKALCYEQVTHVPMIIAHPGIEPQTARSEALVQTIDIAPTMLAMAGIPIPDPMQGADIGAMLTASDSSPRSFLFTENLWSNKFGNPRCESIQNHQWKYIRYYKNETLSASQIISTAQALKLNVNQMLYKVNDQDIARYRSYAEAPFLGEKPVYEEVYNLANDPAELQNLLETVPPETLRMLRKACDEGVKTARGTGDPLVLRYTYESQLEAGKPGNH